jgi:hypothetical protein
LALQIIENPDYLIIFDEATLVSEANGFPYSFRKAIEIKKKINK